MLNRRSPSLSPIGIALVPITGCMTKPLRPINGDGTCC
jgi:hypothetical protein